jgi:hypothetical protein
MKKTTGNHETAVGKDSIHFVVSRATGTQAFLHLFSYPVSPQREHLVKKVLDLYPI